MKASIRITIIFTCLLWSVNASSQQLNTNFKPYLLTADSLASGNYKDVLTSFFQVACNDLSGASRTVEFASNPFALMARNNPQLLVDTSYLRYHHLRDLNFDVGVKIDSAYHLNGFNFGIKYAIINKRDISISRKFIDANFALTREYSTFNQLIGAWVSRNYAARRDFAKELNSQVDLWETKDRFTFDLLSPEIRDTVKAIINSNSNKLPTISKLINENPNLVFTKETDNIYNNLESQWQNKPLWTIGGLSSFSATGPSGNLKNLSPEYINLSSEFLAGINSPKRKIKMDVDILVTDQFTRDTTNPLQNINGNLFQFQPGINFVLKTTNSIYGAPGKPFMEFKISGSYYHQFTALLPGQKADSNTINGELRLRVFQDVWVPVTLKYNPAHGNLFGLISVKANFTALSGILKKMAAMN